MKTINRLKPKLEKQIIKEFVQLFRFKFPKHFKYLIKIANEGTIYNGSYRYGLRKGAADFLFNYSYKKMQPSNHPDMIINDSKWTFQNVRNYNNLWIEFKRHGNKQTTDQIQFQKDMEEAGSEYIVCYSADDAIKAIEEYLKT